eukprot:3440323-Rhodomonas_salina.1
MLRCEQLHGAQTTVLSQFHWLRWAGRGVRKDHDSASPNQKQLRPRRRGVGDFACSNHSI